MGHLRLKSSKLILILARVYSLVSVHPPILPSIYILYICNIYIHTVQIFIKTHTQSIYFISTLLKAPKSVLHFKYLKIYIRQTYAAWEYSNTYNQEKESKVYRVKQRKWENIKFKKQSIQDTYFMENKGFPRVHILRAGKKEKLLVRAQLS